MVKKENKLLTETELELMNILWELEEGTVTDVLKQLPEERILAYTSVSTILRILEKKQILVSRKNGKSHIYTPLLQKYEYETKSVDHILHNVFSDTPASLVKTLVESKNVSMKDLEAIKKVITERLG